MLVGSQFKICVSLSLILVDALVRYLVFAAYGFFFRSFSFEN